MALPDGAHASTEEFSYFTLVNKASSTDVSDSSLFGISCTRQIRADRLKVKSADVTRSFVQKAVVVIVDKPGVLGQLRERVAAITAAWFAQEWVLVLRLGSERLTSLTGTSRTPRY